MGFTGVIIVDDLEMAAISDSMDESEAAVSAIEAGADMVTVAHTYQVQTAVYDALLEAVRSGRLAEERIDESVLRILQMKEKYRLQNA
jgi:beta-N-acetylhexosaminidase